MRVENIGIPRNIPDREQRPGLAEGDVLIAEVTDIKGDKVFLKNQAGGAVLTAKLLGDIGVAVGDYVETVVDEASGGRYVLRVVDISRQAPFATEAELSADKQTMGQALKAQALLSTLAMLKNNPGADPKAAAFLSRHGLAGTADNIETLSQMAKGSSPVTALLTQIIQSFGTSPKTFSQNGSVMPSADAAQNAQPAQVAMQGDSTHSAQSAGQTTADNAGRAAGQTQTQNGSVQSQTASAGTAQSQAATAETVPNQAVSAESGKTSQTQYGPENIPEQALPDVTKMPGANTQTSAKPAPDATVPSAPIQQNQNAPQTEAYIDSARTQARTPQSTPQTAVPIETVPAADGQTPAQTAPLVVNTAAHLPAEEAAGPIPKTGAENNAAEAKTVGFEMEFAADHTNGTDRKGEDIVQKALDMLVRMDDPEKLAMHIKKAVQEMPEQLKELKLLADHADNTVRDTVSAKLGQAEKQMALMSEVKRFDCYQIPLQTAAQQQTTAELFVYRYRGGKKAVDPDNILILLGLDTQFMGRVETLVKTSGKTLNIEFNMEDMRLADEALADAAQLKDVVRQAGYTLFGISIKQLTSRTTVLNAEERLIKEADGSAGNVDIRV